jgi:hypothetical protein
MKMLKLALVLAASSLAAAASAQEMTALSCDDFKPTPEALERFANLKGACEGIVDRDGELYAKFTAIVRRAAGNNVTLYLPATEHTFRVQADSSERVLIGGKKTRVRDLVRGQEIRIYLSVSQFAKPDIEEVAFITEEDMIVDIEIERVPALPTTASIWPTLAGAGLLLLGVGYALRRQRFRAELPLVIIVSAAFVAGSPTAKAETETMKKPARVVTATVQSAAIVEAVNKETRELKLIDASGKRYTIVADETVRNFDQIEPRDRIVMEYLESVAILVVPAGAPELGDAAAVELAPLGSKPGISGVETILVKATVESLNLTDRIATVRYEDGSMRTVKVADDVPLDLVNVGDEVRFRITKAVAVSVRRANDG